MHYKYTFINILQCQCQHYLHHDDNYHHLVNDGMTIKHPLHLLLLLPLEREPIFTHFPSTTCCSSFPVITTSYPQREPTVDSWGVTQLFPCKLCQGEHSKLVAAISFQGSWASDCLTQNQSVGLVVSIEPSGRGMTLMVPMRIGPFPGF